VPIKTQTITIHVLAPAKPALGEACNGCGVCCAAEPCPVSLALLWPHQTPCKALVWSEAEKRYFCGMVLKPSKFLVWLPQLADKPASRLFKRWISADQSCDSDATLFSD
jgi:hypothetical protein